MTSINGAGQSNLSYLDQLKGDAREKAAGRSESHHRSE